MANTNQYSPSAVVAKVDGRTVTDYAADSFITFTPNESIGGVTYGADGGATVYGSSIRGGKLKFSLRQNSQGAQAMDKLLQVQLNKTSNGQKLPFLDVSIYDSISKSTVRGQAIFTDAPEKGFGKEPGTRDYVMELPQGLANATESAG